MKRLLLFTALTVTLISCSNGQEKTATTTATSITQGTISEVIDTKSFHAKMDEAGAIQIIDVRTPAEFNSGHIENAKNINISDAQFEAQIAALDKSKTVLVYCAAGGRSARAANFIKSQGFPAVYDLKGGMGAWNKDGLPTVK
jgi:rhodanese-related sulfurtransferase